jgi:type II secretory pathway component PulM
MEDLRQRAGAAWQGRSPRERRVLRLAAIVLAAAAWLQLLWTAAEQRAHLQQQVERLEYRMALAKSLAARLAGTPAGGDLTAAAAQPLPALAGLTVQATANRYHIVGSVSFDAWVVWLGDLQRGSHVVLTSARIRKGATPGQVDVEGEMERIP